MRMRPITRDPSVTSKSLPEAVSGMAKPWDRWRRSGWPVRWSNCNTTNLWRLTQGHSINKREESLGPAESTGAPDESRGDSYVYIVAVRAKIGEKITVTDAVGAPRPAVAGSQCASIRVWITLIWTRFAGRAYSLSGKSGLAVKGQVRWSASWLKALRLATS